MSDHVLAANRLTRRWLEQVDAGDGVLSGAGVWPLLAVLAASADEPGRGELSAAVGVPADTAMAAAADVIATLDAA
ncbi:MAG: serpin family protein, partial [Jiangellaceae bacterium]